MAWMNLPDTDSLAQALGWIAFAAGVGCFLQRDDRRFKLWMAAECAAYVAHFALLGRPTAVASTAVSLARALASLRTRSPWAAAGFVALSLGLGAWLADGWLSLLPIASSCLGTLALFLLQGLRMRLVMLAGTLLWVVHNALVGSWGGTALELVVAAVNGVTIWRLWRGPAATG